MYQDKGIQNAGAIVGVDLLRCVNLTSARNSSNRDIIVKHAKPRLCFHTFYSIYNYFWQSYILTRRSKQKTKSLMLCVVIFLGTFIYECLSLKKWYFCIHVNLSVCKFNMTAFSETVGPILALKHKRRYVIK